MRHETPVALLAVILAACLAGCAASGGGDRLDALAEDADAKADDTGETRLTYLGQAPLTRDAEEASYSLAPARAGVIYVVDLLNGHPETTYAAGVRFLQNPELPAPEDVDLDSPPMPPVAAPPRVLIYTSSAELPLAPVPGDCHRRACTIDDIDLPDSAYLDEANGGQFLLSDIRPEDQFARLVFAWRDPIDPYTAGLATWCTSGCE